MEELVRRMMTGAGAAGFGGDDEAGGDGKVAGDGNVGDDGDVAAGGDVGGAIAGTGGIAAATVGPGALPSGLWFATKNARAAVHSTKALMSAAGSNFLADLAPAGTVAACDASEDRPSSHVTTR